MHVSQLTEIEEFQIIKKLRLLFPELTRETSDMSILNKHLVRIVANAKLVPLRTYDADKQITALGIQELTTFKAESKNKIRAFLIACHAYILDQHPSEEIQNLKWRNLVPLKEKYRDNEDFRMIAGEEEWNSLLQFRNYLVLSLQVVKEKNKVLLEMSAGMLSNFHLCLSGGKPSRQVKRRHAIYHDETQTVVKPRRSSKVTSNESQEGSSTENGGSRKKIKTEHPRSYDANEDSIYEDKSLCFAKLLLLSKVALQPVPWEYLDDHEHKQLLQEPYVGSFTEVINTTVPAPMTTQDPSVHGRP